MVTLFLPVVNLRTHELDMLPVYIKYAHIYSCYRRKEGRKEKAMNGNASSEHQVWAAFGK